MDSLEVSKLAASVAKDKKAQDILLLDIHRISTLCEIVMICSALNNKHAQAICEAIKEYLEQNIHLRPMIVEGEDTAEWIAIDYGNVIISIFQPHIRQVYNLEELWHKAIKINYD